MIDLSTYVLNWITTQLEVLSNHHARNLLSRYSMFQYAGHSVDQVEKLILQNVAELGRERRINQWNFLYVIGQQE